MANNISNKKYSVKETVAYYIYACNKMYQNNEKISVRNVIEKIISIIKNVKKDVVLEAINTNMLQKIPSDWKFSIHEVLDYSFVIFYALVNEKEKLTEERIIQEMLKELYKNNPKRTLKDAEIIAERVFSELLDEVD